MHRPPNLHGLMRHNLLVAGGVRSALVSANVMTSNIQRVNPLGENSKRVMTRQFALSQESDSLHLAYGFTPYSCSSSS